METATAVVGVTAVEAKVAVVTEVEAKAVAANGGGGVDGGGDGGGGGGDGGGGDGGGGLSPVEKVEVTAALHLSVQRH